MGRAGSNRRRVTRCVRGAHAAVAAGVLVVSVALGACSSDATTTELVDDPADVTVPGPRPTAPAADSTAGLSGTGSELIAQLEEIRDETDLCKVLTGEAFESLLDDDVDVAALVTNPSGVTQLIAVVDSTFSQLVVISPPEVQPAMATIQEVWTRVARLSLGAADAQQRTAEILAEPQVVQATQTLTTWVALNCAGAAGALGQG